MSTTTTLQLTRLRAEQPGLIRVRAQERPRPSSLLGASGRLMVIAADHPARGALGAGADPLAMADRQDLLGRLVAALARPGVNGFLGTADLVEDLLLLGALDGKVVFGSMNRGGIAGTSFEIDDRFTGYDAASIEASGMDGGKMLLRIDPDDPLTAPTLEATSRAVSDLAGRGLVAMVEPFMSLRVDGRLRNDLSPEAVIRSIAIAAGLGATSAYTWLKLPVVDRMEAVLAASTLPTLLLGGEVSADQDLMFERWRAALALPTVVGLTVGRSLLYPPDGDVASAVDTAVSLL
ncbi:MAG: 5-keto-2-deoxy-D-gluconate-6 phosphate aldolase [form 2] [uncultured Nocardioidaceae bacterium]|uniref:5-keto-2-deoxy-D-gluconate-6 phosphate aldolase [form 2] n=1 Tax=uncultured Nocardioidaceae bacterium TaxID=253824 RepID=A0A6J4MDT3_9ACTN|nr:MAG: 5-keto-2-deoxy-D-gluconate-6 phosphate aldolase [form 2] [uncultured Nocardioidaceae bacterium]